MKNLYLLSFSALLLMFVANAYAQDNLESNRMKFDVKTLKFGVRTGCNVDVMEGITTVDDGYSIQASEGLGWQVGGSAYYDVLKHVGLVPNDYFGVETNLLFSNRQYSVGNNTNSLYYLEAPIMSTYVMPVYKKLNLTFQAGPYFGLGLADNGSAFTKHIRRFNCGITVGGGFNIGQFFIGAFNNWGVFNLARNASNRYNQRMNSGNLVLGWSF
jgi:hypothetical protein